MQKAAFDNANWEGEYLWICLHPQHNYQADGMSPLTCAFAFNELNYPGLPEALSVSLRRYATGTALKRGFLSDKCGGGGGGRRVQHGPGFNHERDDLVSTFFCEGGSGRAETPLVSIGSENINWCGNQNTDNVGEGPLTVIN